MFLSRSFRNLGIGISASASSLATALQKINFTIRIFFKVECLCSFLWLVMVSVPLCYKYLVLYDFLSIKSKASIGVLEKSLLNIRKHPSWCFKKNNCSKNFCILCILSSETSKVEFFLSTLVGLPRITQKSSLEQLFCRHGFIRAI